MNMMSTDTSWRDLLGGDEPADHAIGLAKADGVDVEDVEALAAWMKVVAAWTKAFAVERDDYEAAARDLLREYEREE